MARPLSRIGSLALVAVAASVAVSACDGVDEGAPFSLTRAFVEGDELRIGVGYDCGCGDHRFEARWDELFLDEDDDPATPPVVVVTVEHDAEADACEAYCDAVVRFDLVRVRAVFERDFDAESGVVLLRVLPHESRSEPPLELEYAF